MYVIRKAQQHHRNAELHRYRKVGLLVRLSILIKVDKKVERSLSGKVTMVDFSDVRCILASLFVSMVYGPSQLTLRPSQLVPKPSQLHLRSFQLLLRPSQQAMRPPKLLLRPS